MKPWKKKRCVVTVMCGILALVRTELLTLFVRFTVRMEADPRGCFPLSTELCSILRRGWNWKSVACCDPLPFVLGFDGYHFDDATWFGPGWSRCPVLPHCYCRRLHGSAAVPSDERKGVGALHVCFDRASLPLFRLWLFSCG